MPSSQVMLSVLLLAVCCMFGLCHGNKTTLYTVFYHLEKIAIQVSAACHSSSFMPDTLGVYKWHPSWELRHWQPEMLLSLCEVSGTGQMWWFPLKKDWNTTQPWFLQTSLLWDTAVGKCTGPDPMEGQVHVTSWCWSFGFLQSFQ